MQEISSPLRINFMVNGGMTNPKMIDKAAKDFYKAVVAGMLDRPKEFETDKLMAKAAGVKSTTFNEYKLGKKGSQRPNFFSVYKIAYVLANGPPCSLGSETLIFNRFQEARNSDKWKILDKVVALILAGSDLESEAASIEVRYKRLFPPEKLSQNS